VAKRGTQDGGHVGRVGLEGGPSDRMGERVSQRAGAVSTEQRGAARSYRQCTAGKAARAAPNRIGLLLGSCSQMSRNLLPISLSPLFAGPKYRKPKMASHDLRAWSFEDGCLCSILHGPPSYFLLTSSLLWHANRPHNFLKQPSLNHLSPPKDHLLPARFCSHLQPVSRLYIAVLPL